MKKLIFVTGLACFISTTASGALHDRGGGFIYDDVQDLTWVQNVSLSGSQDWATNMLWVEDLSLYDSVRDVTWDDWRLPNSDVDGDGIVSSCSILDEEPCLDNELGYISSPQGYLINQQSPGPFTGWGGAIGTSFVSSSTKYFPPPDDFYRVWGYLNFIGGGVGFFTFQDETWGWAVRDGDVAAAVVEDVDIDIAPGSPANTVHPHHNDVNVSPYLNDVIAVAVLTSSTVAGDPIDFDATTIDASTVRFGPAEGSIDPASTPIFSADQDSDGLNDALLHFLTGDTGVGCADTDMTITGETTTGVNFTGADSISTDCNALCHN
jgi:hypothetical protein